MADAANGRAPKDEELRGLRILIVSPLARTALARSRGAGTFMGAEFAEVAAARTPSEVSRLVTARRHKFDVVLVDVMWNDFDYEWSYDGLDVIAAIRASQRYEDVLLACQGHRFEIDFLEEGRSDPLVKGAVLKSNDAGVLTAIARIAKGEPFFDTAVESRLPPESRRIHAHFDRSSKLAHMACAMALGVADDYRALADVLGFSEAAVSRAPELFGEMMSSRGEFSGDRNPPQSAIFRWCGRHAAYIVSWSRRHRESRPPPPALARRLDELQLGVHP